MFGVNVKPNASTQSNTIRKHRSKIVSVTKKIGNVTLDFLEIMMGLVNLSLELISIIPHPNNAIITITLLRKGIEKLQVIPVTAGLITPL